MRHSVVREIWGRKKGFVWPKRDEGYTGSRWDSRTLPMTLSKSG